MLHVRRDRGIKAVMLFCDGVDEPEVPRVEGLAFEISNGYSDRFLSGLVGCRIGALLAVKWIAQKRAADMSEVDTNLVGPPGF